jgi:hypothetical protein
VTSGGNVVVLGYPEIVEDPALWSPLDKSVGLCQGIRPSDALELRGLAGDLNATIAEAIKAANADPPSARHNVTFTYVDVNTGNPKAGILNSDQSLYEPNTGSRHNLSAAKEWINGIAASLAGANPATDVNTLLNHSFHPNQPGNDAMARLVEQVVPTLNWSQLATPVTVARSELGQLAPGLHQTIVTLPDGYEAATWDDQSHITFWRFVGSGPWATALTRLSAPSRQRRRSLERSWPA